MSGTIPLSLSQRLDNISHLPLALGKLYFIEAGTTSTPQNAFQDSALTIPWPNPLTLDEGGNIPQLFFADGQIKIRLENSAGVVQLGADNIQVIGASSGSGGGGTVDPTTILATGDMKAAYGTGVLVGFVRINGRTIGSASSGASERANADCQSLFQYLWSTDPNLVVSTGRGISANADWVANKQITLPDMRGRGLGALDDMGNSAAGRLTASYFGTDATVLGAAGGAESHSLTITEMAAHAHGVTDPGHAHTVAPNGEITPNTAPVGVVVGINPTGNTFPMNTNSVGTGISIQSNGGGAAHAIASPMLLTTIYMKL